MNAAQRESLKTLGEKLDTLKEKMKEDKKKAKKEQEEQAKKANNHVAMMCEQTLQSAISSADYRIKQIEIANNEFKLAKEEEKKNKGLEDRIDEKKIHSRLDELTDFYRHMNKVVESIIEKFSVLEKVNNRVLKQQQSGLSQYAATLPPQNSSLPPIHQDLIQPTSLNIQQAQQSFMQSYEQAAYSNPVPMMPSQAFSPKMSHPGSPQLANPLSPQRQSSTKFSQGRGSHTPKRRYGNYVPEQSNPALQSTIGSRDNLEDESILPKTRTKKQQSR